MLNKYIRFTIYFIEDGIYLYTSQVVKELREKKKPDTISYDN